jgi:hypothetical protein
VSTLLRVWIQNILASCSSELLPSTPISLSTRSGEQGNLAALIHPLAACEHHLRAINDDEHVDKRSITQQHAHKEKGSAGDETLISSRRGSGGKLPMMRGSRARSAVRPRETNNTSISLQSCADSTRISLVSSSILCCRKLFDVQQPRHFGSGAPYLRHDILYLHGITTLHLPAGRSKTPYSQSQKQL